jgi:ankyrin repeat protein
VGVNELVKITGPRRGIVFALQMTLVAVAAPFNVWSAESGGSVNLSPVSSARTELESLLARAASISNVTATLERRSGRSETLIDSRRYYRSIAAGITRIEQLGTLRSADGQTSPVVTYALLIDEVARLVYAQAHGQLAVLDFDSAQTFLSITDLLAGKPSQLGSGDLELTSVYRIGSDVVDDIPTEVFIFETKPRRDQRLWVDSQRGLVCKARWQNATYKLTGIKINAELDKNLFALNFNSHRLTEINQMHLGRWSAQASVMQFTNAVRNNTAPATIFAAADAGDTNAMQTFLVADGQLAYATNVFGFAPLHYAAMEGHTNVVELLIANKAGVDPRNRAGATPLWLAAANGRLNVVQFLISKGASIETRNKVAGLTPLHIAALNGHKEVVQLLLSKGANPHELTAAGETASQLAIRRGHTEVVDLLNRRDEGAAYR